MIIQIKKINSRLAIIHNAPKLFFKRIEDSNSFGNHLFPSWISIFDNTDLKLKFEDVYNKYKRIKSKRERDKIVNAFFHTNQVFKLCDKDAHTLMIELGELHHSIRNSIKELFLYLYNKSINYNDFIAYVGGDNISKIIKLFIKENGILVCPICGLESFSVIDGQVRPSLDHWLYKAKFPMASVNFNNLVPMGDACNRAPAKGAKNVLIDQNTNNRTVAYHPYIPHSGISTSFCFINEPSINGISDSDWSYSMVAQNHLEQDKFLNWCCIFNIERRYKDFFRTLIFEMWEEEYKEFVEDDDSGLSHAETILELKNNLKIWKSTFQIKKRPGATQYRDFIDFLINQASDAYLYGIGRNLENTVK